MRKFVVVALLLTALAVAAPASAQTGALTIRKVDTEAFPKVTVTVASSGLDAFSAEQLFVQENGARIDILETDSLMSSGKQIDVVLVIDTSGSMLGDAMAAAKRAAVDFVKALPDGVRVGTVTFSDRPHLIQGITTDHSSVIQRIRTLEATGETALYDGVAMAAGLFSGPNQRNVVLLSDGGDTASASTLNAAAQAIRKSVASVFAVGLETTETDVAALKRLANVSRGSYASAANAELSTIYQNLATEIRGQFVVTYESAAGSEEVDLTIGMPGAIDEVTFLAPERIAPPRDVRPSEPAPSPVRGPAGMILSLTLFFLAVASIIFMASGSRARRKRNEELARRFDVKGPTPASRTGDHSHRRLVPTRLGNAAGRAVHGSSMASRIDRKLEQAGLKLTTGEFVVGTIGAGLAAALIGATLAGIAAAVLLGAVGLIGPFLWLSLSARGRTSRIKGQLPDVLMILASSLRAGHSFLQALDAVAREIGAPSDHEFNRAVAEIRLGRPMGESLNDLADRIGSDDFKWAVLAIGIQKEVGGNLAEVLDTVAATLRERDDVRRQVQTLSAEGRLSAYILTALPFALGLYLQMINPEAVGLLFSTSLGRIMVGGGTTLLLLGTLWMRKMVKIDV
ncbi:MAG TPA: type II secretion system F family protein [Actinomycetota bacterium]|nr:type II secretion system F family protein [Actinomycetota bacterium]